MKSTPFIGVFLWLTFSLFCIYFFVLVGLFLQVLWGHMQTVREERQKKIDYVEFEGETRDAILSKKLWFGDFESFLKLYFEFFTDEEDNPFTFLKTLQTRIKDPRYYDLAFVILLNDIIKKPFNRILLAPKQEIIHILEGDKIEMAKNEYYYIFESSGISNIEYFTPEEDPLKTLKTEINTFSILKILKILDTFYKFPRPKYNLDSINRYFNIFDLLVLDTVNTIDRTILNMQILNIKVDSICDFVATEELKSILLKSKIKQQKGQIK